MLSCWKKKQGAIFRPKLTEDATSILERLCAVGDDDDVEVLLPKFGLKTWAGVQKRLSTHDSSKLDSLLAKHSLERGGTKEMMLERTMLYLQGAAADFQTSNLFLAK